MTVLPGDQALYNDQYVTVLWATYNIPKWLRKLRAADVIGSHQLLTQVRKNLLESTKFRVPPAQKLGQSASQRIPCPSLPSNV